MQGTSKCDISLAFVLLNHTDFWIRCCGCFCFTELKMIERRAFGVQIVNTDGHITVQESHDAPLECTFVSARF